MYYYEQDPPQSREAPQRMVFDGKRMRKPIQRKTVDYQSPAILYTKLRMLQRDRRDLIAVQPSEAYQVDLLPPIALDSNPSTSICTKFVHTSTNKVRCPINQVIWTPEGRRLITGSSSGEFTLWNGLTFNFETILQAHVSAVRKMLWSHDENWMVTGDDSGTVRYWQNNMNNVKDFQAHKEAIRGLSFSPSDMKLVSCSDDVTIKIWDFARCHEESILTGHGWDVKCVAWHPFKSMIISGSKDNLIKIWDPKTSKNITTLHGHKNTILEVTCNKNGNWLLSASRDQLLKLFDIRMMKELTTFRGHKKEVTSAAWHPHHESLFCSGGFDGSIFYWEVGSDEPLAQIPNAHDSSVWSLAWHPFGHLLCSGSNDHSTKFWSRNRPGDSREKDAVEQTGDMDTEMNESSSSSAPSLPSQPSSMSNFESLPGLSSTLQSSSSSSSITSPTRQPAQYNQYGAPLGSDNNNMKPPSILAGYPTLPPGFSAPLPTPSSIPGILGLSSISSSSIPGIPGFSSSSIPGLPGLSSSSKP